MPDTERSVDTGATPLPVDLAAVVSIGVCSLLLVLFPAFDAPVLRAFVGALLVFIAPGYALLAALFPAGDRDQSRRKTDQLDGIERIVLGAALSLGVTGLAVVALGLLSVSLVPTVVVGFLAVFSIFTAIAAGIRRRQLPESIQYHVGLRSWSASVRARLRAFRARPLEQSNLVVLVVVVSLAVAASGAGFAMTQRTTGEEFTELSLRTESPSGDLVASDYPTTFVSGESKSVVVTIGNHEQRALSYTVVVTVGTDDLRTLNTVSTETVPAGETATIEQQVAPERAGEGQKLSFLLYRGDAPTDPTPENAYRETHLWISVSDSA